MAVSTTPARGRKKPRLAWAVGTALVGALVVLWLGREAGWNEVVSRGMEVLRRAGPGVFFAAMAVVPAPLFWFTIPAGGVFADSLGLGGVIAVALTAVGVNLALSYWVARVALRPLVVRMLQGGGYMVPQVSANNAWSVVLLVRLTPGPPLFLQCYLLAVAGVPFGLYLGLSWLVTVPWVVGGILMGRGILGGSFTVIASGAGVLAGAMIALRQVRRMAGKKTGSGGADLSPGEGPRGRSEGGMIEARALPESVFPPYVYRSVDRSVLCAWLMERVWRPALRWVPFSTHANTLTLAGNLSALGAFTLVLAIKGGAPDGLLLVVALMLLVYVSLDNMDGAQARRTGSSSPLGEFFDHWGDGLNLGTTVLGFGLMAGLPAGLTWGCLGAAAVAYFATMWEQRRTGCMHLGVVGVLEGLLALCGLYLVMAVCGRGEWLMGTAASGVTWIQWTALGVCAAMVGTVGIVVARVGEWAGDWWRVGGMAGGLVAWLVCAEPPEVAATVVLIGLIPRLGGRQIVARLTGAQSWRGDAGLMAALALAAALGAVGVRHGQEWFAWGMAGYLTTSAVGDACRTIRMLRGWRPAVVRAPMDESRGGE